MSYDFSTAANSIEEMWMPFTAQRTFKKAPRMLVSAKGMYYKDQDGREVLDGSAGLWCVNAGHNIPRIKNAIKEQLELLDYATCFSMGHPTAFKAASRLTAVFPKPFTHVFFSNSGSEAVDSALKVALAYWRKKGEGQRRIFIGRERAYHGVGFGGLTVGGIPYNRKMYGQLLPYVDHLPHTLNLEKNAFSRGQPAWGASLADELEKLVYLHDAENIAAVIVEPMSCSTGVLPPPKGYLEKLREITKKHNILLIFDEVVTGFGRLGKMCAAEYFNIMPDMICTAKALTNGTVPMAATFIADHVHQSFMTGPEGGIEFPHGYTYSGHPLAAAAAIATLDTLLDDKIIENAAKMAPVWEAAMHSLKDKPGVIDIRNFGIACAIQFEKRSDDYDHGWEVFTELFNRGLAVRPTSPHTIALSPPLILEKSHIEKITDILGSALDSLKNKMPRAA